MKATRNLSDAIASRAQVSAKAGPLQAQELPIGLLYARDDARPVSTDRVAALAESIRDVGLINPIVVRPVQKHRHGSMAKAWEILAGHHRFRACSVNLRMDTVPCIVRDEDDAHAELVMIDENLCRADLTPAQAAQQTARRKELYETLHPETRQHVAGAWVTNGGANDKLSSAAETADRTGRDRRTVERDAARGKALGDDLSRIAGTSLDKGVELDALAKMPAEKREPLIRQASEGKPVSARVTNMSCSGPEARRPKSTQVRGGRAIGAVPIDELHALVIALEDELRTVQAEIARRSDIESWR